jgi:hypothetical protein
MVRVKSQPKLEIMESLSVRQFKDSEPLDLDIECVTNEHFRNDSVSETRGVIRRVQTLLEAISSRNKVKLEVPDAGAENKLQDTVTGIDPSVEFVKEQYKKASNYSIIALILLIITPFTLVSVIGAIVLSILALRIYRRYKNPGVDERYVLAITVLILSILAVLLSLGFLYLLFTLL